MVRLRQKTAVSPATRRRRIIDGSAQLRAGLLRNDTTDGRCKAEGGGKTVTKVLQLTAIIEREDESHVATCPELDVVSQGETVEAARQNLLEAVEGFFEVASPSEIRRRLKRETYIMSLLPTAQSVSYTHLTLPTSDLV